MDPQTARQTFSAGSPSCRASTTVRPFRADRWKSAAHDLAYSGPKVASIRRQNSVYRMSQG